MIKPCLHTLDLKKIFFNCLMKRSHCIYMRILNIVSYIQLFHLIFNDMKYHLQNNISILNYLMIEFLWNRHLNLLLIFEKLMLFKCFFTVRVCLWQLYIRLLFFYLIVLSVFVIIRLVSDIILSLLVWSNI